MISGLETVKKLLQQLIVLPIMRPDLIEILGGRHSVLLFGVPGTGYVICSFVHHSKTNMLCFRKTMMAICAANQIKATFFNVTAASITDKWLGNSEKLIRALFLIAEEHAPSIIFMDEVQKIFFSKNIKCF
jgi:fidgetin-like protein 1